MPGAQDSRCARVARVRGLVELGDVECAVLLAALVFDRPAALAVADPRIDTPPTGGLSADAAFPPEIVIDLARRGEVVDATKPNFSAVQAVRIGVKDGVRFLDAGADPRKGGAVLVE